MVTIGFTCSPRVVRVTSATHRICWGVESTYATPDQGEHVEYEVTHPVDGVVLSGDATVYHRARPEFSDVPSPLPGAGPGQAPIRCYSLVLDLDALPAGKLTVEATAHGHDGSSVALETIVVVNDYEGDSRPSTAVVHWRNQTGSNSNGGTSSSDAVRDLQRAITLALSSGCAGGATIICHEDVVGNGNDGSTSPPSFYTDDYFLTIEAAAPGVTWRAHSPPFTSFGTTSGGDLVAVNASGAGAKLNIRLRGFTFTGGGLSLYDSSSDGDLYLWVEGGEWGSEYWDDDGPRVRCLEDTGTAFNGPMSTQNGSGRTGGLFMNGTLIRGVGVGITAHGIVYDVEIKDHLGGTTYASGHPTDKAVFHSIVAHGHDYERNVTRGWGANRTTEGSPEALESVDMGGGVMRILGPVAGLRFDLALADNVGSTLVRLGIRNWAGTGTDATGRVIVGTGITGGRPYVDIEHTAAGYGAAPGGAEIETVIEWTPGAGTWEWFADRIHPSSLSRDEADGRDVVIFRDIAVYDSVNEVQSHFSNLEGPIEHLLIDNVRDAATGANWAMGVLTAEGYHNSIFRRITAAASGLSIDADATNTGSQMTNCVFRNASANLADAQTEGLEVGFCHFVEDEVGDGWHGSSPTFGTFYDGSASPTASPWDYTPDALDDGDPRAAVGLAGGDWTDTGSTRGCLPDVALLDFSLDDEEPAEPIDAAGEGVLGLFGGAEGAVDVTAAGSGFLGLFGDGDGAIEFVPIEADAAGHLGLFGASSITATVHGHTVGALPLFGDAAGTMDAAAEPISAVGTGFLGLRGAGVGEVVMGATLAFQQVTASGGRIIRAPGRIVIDPLDGFAGGSYPYGGSEIGRANLCVLQPLGEPLRVFAEGLGETNEILEPGSRWVWSCFLRGWNDKAVELLLPDGFAEGDVSQHAVFSAPGSQYAGRSALDRARKLLFVPDDPIHVPAVILYRAVPDWSEGAELQFRRGEELGLPLVFECLRDDEGRILQVGRIVDLKL